ncbi:MAG TPA: GNAT family N-acetyltransferase/peptidase C39 family protein [Gammaproteobacteria bacterium]|nr:GNAT family N-acetyltransferase/peptidase C39 family protein [Gammaproteobacteria bacterium]
MIRPATLDDLEPLVRLEEHCFDSDRLSRRNFRYLIGRGNAALLVDVQGDVLRGYALVLFRTGTSLARLYSIAVAPEHRGGGIAQALLERAEDVSRERDCIAMRLEIRVDNAAAERLYRKMGYRPFGTYPDYYEDHADALRMEKSLIAHLKPATTRVPYYEQTLDFTCGPATLIMAMQALDPTLAPSRKLEIRLWREATTVFMTSGHGGCGPYGMALSAWRRGFDVEIFVNDKSALFVDSVRNPEKKAVIRLTQEDFLDEIRDSAIRVHYHALGLRAMQAQFEAGAIPVVLISSYRIYREKFPHWVTVTGFDDRFVYVHDPYVEYDKHKGPLDSINMPILKREFEGMARYGKAAQRAALVIRKKQE